MFSDILRLLSFFASSDLFRLFFVVLMTEFVFILIYALSHGGRF